jgi:hypothetical protein
MLSTGQDNQVQPAGSRKPGASLCSRALLIASVGVLVGTVFAILDLIGSDATPISRHLMRLLPHDELLLLLSGLILIGLIAPLVPFQERTQRMILAAWLLATLLAFWWLDLIFPLAAVAVRGLALVLLGTALHLALIREQARQSFWIFAAGAVGLGILGSFMLSGLLSVAGLYSFNALLALDSAVIVLAGAFITRRHKDIVSTLRAAAASTIRNVGTSVMPVACLALVGLSRANLPPDADSAWYALGWLGRVSESTIFAPNGYVHFGHYYPKGFELAAGWLSGVSDPAFMILFSGVLYVLICLAVIDFLSRGTLDRLTASLIGVALLAAPAGLGFAPSAKPDTLGVFALILTSIGAVRLVERSDAPSIELLVIGAALAASAKLQFAMYALPIVALAFAYIAVSGQARFAGRRARLVLPFCVLGLAIICARTYLHTGMAVVGPESAVAIQEAFGMSARNPFSSVHLDMLGRGTPAGLEGIASVLLWPSRGGHLWWSWPGLEWLGLWLAALCQIFKGKNAKTLWLLAMSVVMLAIALSFVALAKLPVYLGDGNYYFGALVAGALLLWSRDLTFSERPWVIGLTRYATAAIAFLLLALVYLSGWGDRYGVVPESEVARGSTLLRAKRLKIRFEHFQLSPVASAMESRPECNALILSTNRRPKATLYRLPCRVENIRDLLYLRQSDVVAGGGDNFEDYICWSGLDFVLLDREENDQKLKGTLEWLARTEPPTAVQTERWVLYDVSGLEACNKPSSESTQGRLR